MAPPISGVQTSAVSRGVNGPPGAVAVAAPMHCLPEARSCAVYHITKLRGPVANTSGAITELDDVALNNREDVIVLATRNPGSGTVTDFDEPLAVNYFSGRWSVVRLDDGAMPTTGGFHIYAQPPSINAFRHVASAVLERKRVREEQRRKSIRA